MVVGATLALSAAAATAGDIPQLQEGAVEIGIGAAITSVERSHHVTLTTRGGYFWNAPGGLVAAEAEVGYVHIESLDRLDLGLQTSWQPILADRPYHPYVGFGAAVRQEFVGSFSQTRYPVGVDFGLRTLVARSVLVRTELRVRRVLSDPVANFTEIGFLAGVSLVLRNR